MADCPLKGAKNGLFIPLVNMRGRWSKGKKGSARFLNKGPLLNAPIGPYGRLNSCFPPSSFASKEIARGTRHLLLLLFLSTFCRMHFGASSLPRPPQPAHPPPANSNSGTSNLVRVSGGWSALSRTRRRRRVGAIRKMAPGP